MGTRYSKYKPPFQDRNRAGEKICVMCGKPLTGRKRRWCGDNKCFQRAFLRSGDQSAMRRYLLNRDKGICAGCGVDLETIQELDDILTQDHQWSHKEWIEFLKQLDIDPGWHMHYWEAHHITPFSKGGAHHEDNLQILCLKCHHKKARKIKYPEQIILFQ